MLKIKEFYDQDTATLTYVVHKGQACVVIDPVHNLDVAAGRMWHKSHRELLDYLNTNSLVPQYCLETHVHADHVTGAQLLKASFPGVKIAISERIKTVQKVFNDLLDLDADVSCFDFLLEDHKNYTISEGSDSFAIKIIPTPGHTPACTSFLIEDCVFVGDLIFMPDYGTGRCDFPKGSAESLYDSITQQIYTLPDSTKLYTGHDYLPNSRELKFMCTIGEQKKLNIHLPAGVSKDEFVTMRTKRDVTLAAPKLLFPSLQLNVYAGRLPHADRLGRSFLKLPLFFEKNGKNP
jgi:glyoxylase-like metal-dependent hydrolase (beta-lactamase superfamily II)